MQSDVRESRARRDRYRRQGAQLYRELRLKHWATGPPAFCRRPFSWCRADPHPAACRHVAMAGGTRPKRPMPLLLAVPVLGHVVLLFFLIDKRDEYQLCNYILKFKATQFLSSGIPAATLASAALHARSKTMRATARPARPAPTPPSSTRSSSNSDPHRHPLVRLAPSRSGYARGGREELFALRRCGSTQTASSTERDLAAAEALTRGGRVSHVVADGRANARAAHGVQRRTGGASLLFLYDVTAPRPLGVCNGGMS